MHVVGDPLNDARAYYDAAARLNAGQALYPPGIDPSTNRIYLYPPLLAMLLRPLALLPYEWFAVIWEIFVVTCFVLLVRHLGVRRKETWLTIGVLGVPIGWALAVAQAHIPMTLLIAIGQPWSIAVAANIKLFPVLIVLWWLGRREFEAVAAFAMWSVLLVLAQVLAEPGGSFAYFQRVGFEQIGEGTIRNFSPFVLSPVIWASLLAVGAIATLALARTKWGWAVAVTFATLAPPRLLVYMLTSIVAGRPPAAACARARSGGDRRRRLGLHALLSMSPDAPVATRAAGDATGDTRGRSVVDLAASVQGTERRGVPDPTGLDRGRSSGLDGLRAFAALLVVAFHLNTVNGVSFGPARPVRPRRRQRRVPVLRPVRLPPVQAVRPGTGRPRSTTPRSDRAGSCRATSSRSSG